MSDKDFLIDVFNSVSGLRIELWNSDYNHAVSGHPEVTIEKIKASVEDPFRVVQSKKSNRVCLFYSLEKTVESYEQTYFCVVVGVVSSGKGRIETAYETNFIKTGTILMQKK